jgi:4'-phosphopantetheinyl transferase EntD
MADLGLPGAPVPIGEDRAPIWPDGLVGGIAHDDSHCLAALARTQDAAALGIDLEPDLPLERALWESVLTPNEHSWLDSRPMETRGRLARLIFSAKECAYKGQYPLTRTLCAFTDMRVEIDAAGGAYAAVLLRDLDRIPGGTRLEGRFAVTEGVIVTALVLR